MDFLNFTLALIILIGVFLFLSVKIVPQAEQWVVERLGRYHKTLHGGINFIIPFVDQRRSKYNTQEQIIDIPEQKVITKDNVSIGIDAVVFMRIYDAQKATYEILDLKESVSQLAQTTLRSEIGRLELDETLSSRSELNAALLKALDDASGTWGAKVSRVEVADIIVPQKVQDSMELMLEAERKRRAVETEAQGQKNATIRVAEGERQKAFLEAEALERTAEAKRFEKEQLALGDQKAMEMINQAMSENHNASEFLLAKDRIQAFSGIAASDSANKVVVPIETSEMVGSLTALMSALNIGDGTTNSVSKVAPIKES
ncbi:SPFH/Band 7/PHB domain protein [Thiomicrorhabdus sp. 6S2-11]|jgi:regulator of protease activity HflC (stomatin/prohibitin superfamily)|uniref:SPFH/Band 7/PHB domain protein n=1 Tax=Thiomicrorhabdus marina TaxID=2818442 RepID=A0ABS3Q5Q1_9GAMM|nr:SPFH domain-containing protein [Thiomicrorhabdus marina]MBO1927616.1 SPFH/Band 7/PHB domain protein [Thiomicrorhabdus marina]